MLMHAPPRDQHGEMYRDMQQWRESDRFRSRTSFSAEVVVDPPGTTCSPTLGARPADAALIVHGAVVGTSAARLRTCSNYYTYGLDGCPQHRALRLVVTADIHSLASAGGNGTVSYLWAHRATYWKWTGATTASIYGKRE